MFFILSYIDFGHSPILLANARDKTNWPQSSTNGNLVSFCLSFASALWIRSKKKALEFFEGRHNSLLRFNMTFRATVTNKKCKSWKTCISTMSVVLHCPKDCQLSFRSIIFAFLKLFFWYYALLILPFSIYLVLPLFFLKSTESSFKKNNHLYLDRFSPYPSAFATIYSGLSCHPSASSLFIPYIVYTLFHLFLKIYFLFL